MSYQRRRRGSEEGIVSIITVLMFAIILSVLSIGFLRVMLDEQQQTLEDDLAKSAYNSAQAGVEDAKRAILYCAGLSGVTTKSACETQLYTATCPGFNAGTYFSTIGIPQASGAQTRVGNSGLSQGYSCVTISKFSDSLNGSLALNTTSSSDIVQLQPELNQTIRRLKIEWHEATSNPIPSLIRPTSDYNRGNPRQPEANGSPAVLRVTLVSQSKASNILPSDMTIRSTFMYPTYDASDNPTLNSWSWDGGLGRYMASCNTANDFMCTGYIDFSSAPSTTADRNYYLVLETLYASTNYRISAFTSSNALIRFEGVEPVIDSTGYSNDVFRRVRAHVRLGSAPLALTSALDAAGGICKDFRVGATISVFNDSCTPGAVLSGASIDGEVDIGGWCSVPGNVCDGNSNDDNADVIGTRYSKTFTNLSDNAPSLVASCRWTISDGTTRTDRCYYGDSFKHYFPNGVATSYTVRLEVTLTNGTVKTKTITTSMPW